VQSEKSAISCTGLELVLGIGFYPCINIMLAEMVKKYQYRVVFTGAMYENKLSLMIF
jgi:hypothetical protein